MHSVMITWMIRLTAIAIGVLLIYVAGLKPDSSEMYLGAAFFFVLAAFSLAKESLALMLFIAGLGSSVVPIIGILTEAIDTPHLVGRRGTVYLHSERIFLSEDPVLFWSWVGGYGSIAIAFTVAALYFFAPDKRKKELAIR